MVLMLFLFTLKRSRKKTKFSASSPSLISLVVSVDVTYKHFT